MEISIEIYRFDNGNMRLFKSYVDTYDVISMSIPISRWYRKNDYAKRIDKWWICQDYRIDQQRIRNPKRNVKLRTNNIK